MAKEYLDKTGLTYFWSKLKTLINGKQDSLVSGTNIKTINGDSILGSGNITIDGGGSGNFILGGEAREFTVYSEPNEADTQLQMKHENASSLMLDISSSGSMKLRSVPYVDGDDDWDSASVVWDKDMRNVVTNNASSLGASLESLLTVQSHSLPVQTVSGGQTFENLTVSKSGYFPLAFLGFRATGTGVTQVNVYAAVMTGATSGQATFEFRARDLSGTNNRKITFTVYIMWLKIA